MKIGVIGLGLIGSSIARAVKKYTDYKVAGHDRDDSVAAAALQSGVVDQTGVEAALSCDLVFVCLFPQAAVEFILSHNFANIVCDVCGVKGFVSEKCSGIPGYVGLHPMAGREVSGYHAGDADLFMGASLIITQDKNTNENNIRAVQEFAAKIGFKKMVITTPEKHDQVIAYTSQLAHVVSNAYVKSERAGEYVGYSAGSFADLTRVARLDPVMWAELFSENSKPLIEEIDNLISRLLEYKNALAQGDRDELIRLLGEGRDRKEYLDQLKKESF